MDFGSTATSWHWIMSGMTLLLFFLFIILQQGHKKKKTKLPPGPPAWPIVGNLFQLGKKPNESLFDLAKKYGPLMTLRLGMMTTVVVSSPAMAKEFLKHNDQIFAGRTVIEAVKCASYCKSSLAWNEYGPHWRMLRRICSTELFTAKRLNALQHLRSEQVFQAIRLIHEEDYLKGNAVNIGRTAFTVSLNLLGNMTFSRNIFGRDSKAAQELKETVSKTMQIVGAPNLVDFFPFLRFLDPQGISRDMTKYLKRVFALLDTLIEDRISSSTQNSSDTINRGDFLDVLLDYSSAGHVESSKFTRSDITPLLYTLFLAGSETTSSTIEWAMAELMRNPHTMQRAQAELDEVVGRDRKLEESDIHRLPYLDAVVKEVFRLHPAGPLLLPHRAEISCEIAGFAIPKHSQVIVNVWAIGRDPSVWDSALEFVPERFTKSEIDYKGNDFELIPFGAGRRICPGLILGSRMVRFVLGSLLHSFDWSLPSGQNPEQMDMTEMFGITMQKALPLLAIPTARLSAVLY